MARGLSVSAVMAVLSIGCGDLVGNGSGGPRESGQAQVGGRVVSTVDGRAITVDDVAAVTGVSDLARQEALRRLQEERLLRAEAVRRKLPADAETRSVARQALVQALIDEEAEKVEVDEAELREAYAEQKGRFVKLESRTSLHVFAAVKEDASEEDDAKARAFAEGVVRRLRDAEDPEATWKSYVGVKFPGLTTAAQRLPAADRESSFVKEYLDALFSVERPSTVPVPVRTSHGWHAILVTKIDPAMNVDFEGARETLHDELLTKKRKAHIDAFVAQLRSDTEVKLAADFAARLAEFEP